MKLKTLFKLVTRRPVNRPTKRKPVLEQIVIRWKEIVSRSLVESRSHVQTGLALSKAKRVLGNKKWREVLEAGGFGLDREEAAMLLRIVANDVLVNPQFRKFLPTCPQALSRLAQVEKAALEKAVRSGTVSPIMTAEQAAEFVANCPNQATGKSPNAPLAFNGNRQAALLAERITDELSHWPVGEQVPAPEFLFPLADSLRGEP